MNLSAPTLQQAAGIANGALQAEKQRGFAPLSAAQLDAGGHILVVLRDERASIYRPQIAIGKASGCFGMGFGGRELAKRSQAMPQFFTALSAIFPGGMVPGGVLIRRSDALLVGADSVSGDPTQDVTILQSKANLRVIMKSGHLDKQIPIH